MKNYKLFPNCYINAVPGEIELFLKFYEDSVCPVNP